MMATGRIATFRIEGNRAAMVVLELINTTPDWMNALGVALTRPAGVPERRAEEDPWNRESDRPRRISDDLAWLRQAMDQPETSGLKGLEDTAAVGAWEANETAKEHLQRLRDRHVLDAAGFLLHEEAHSLM
jgi:hypothetical protein